MRDATDDRGILLLIKKYRDEFRRPENINCYSEEDYKRAERKFIKYCLEGHLNESDVSRGAGALRHKAAKLAEQ